MSEEEEWAVGYEIQVFVLIRVIMGVVCKINHIYNKHSENKQSENKHSKYISHKIIFQFATYDIGT